MRILPISDKEAREIKKEKINEIGDCLYEIIEIQKIIKVESLVNTRNYLFKQLNQIIKE